MNQMRQELSVMPCPVPLRFSSAARLDHHAFFSVIDATNEAIPTVLRKPFMRYWPSYEQSVPIPVKAADEYRITIHTRFRD
jgi:hypothetical protein